MKLSDIKGDRVFDVIADLIDPVASIAQDAQAAALFRPAEGEQTSRAQRLRAALPALLRTHKQDLTAILSTIQGVSAEEYRAGLNLGVLLRDCLELLNDPQFSELFPSAQTETQPGSAQANTEALPL